MEGIARTLLLSLLCACGCLGRENDSRRADSEATSLGDLLWKCTKTEDVENCLKLNAIDLLDHLLRMREPLVVTEYLSLARDPKAPESDFRGPEYGEEERTRDWDKIIWSKLTALFKTRIPQLTLFSNTSEGRSKEDKILKKGHGVFLAAAMMGGMMMKMALGKIALIAGKALIIGKIALVLTLIIALKKFAGHGGGGHAEVVYASSEHGSGRKFLSEPLGGPGGEGAAELAYNAHR